MKKINEADFKYRHGDHGPKYLMRGPNIDWGVIFLKAGEQMGAHGHEKTEETFYILDGTGTFLVNDAPHPYETGDVFYLEPKEKHDIQATDPTKLIFIKHPYLPDDKIAY